MRILAIVLLLDVYNSLDQFAMQDDEGYLLVAASQMAELQHLMQGPTSDLSATSRPCRAEAY
jgi:hypothetical protein